MYRRRIEFPGAIYHVIQRGNNREKIFRNELDKASYLGFLVELKSKYGFQLLGYVLMDNHYHLLIQVGDVPLQKIIYRQNMFYSRYFNRKYNRTGHLYGERYKASLIQDEKYAFAVLRYIHWNPVNAKVLTSVSEYPWSSDNCYRENRSENVDIDLLLNTLNPHNRKQAMREYKRIMRAGEEETYKPAKIVGDEGFITEIEEEVPRAGWLGKPALRKTLDEILKAVCSNQEDYNLIKAGSRKRRLIPYKSAYIKAAIDSGYTYREIGKNINISGSAVALYL